MPPIIWRNLEAKCLAVVISGVLTTMFTTHIASMMMTFVTSYLSGGISTVPSYTAMFMINGTTFDLLDCVIIDPSG